jgi:hypothetical protein
MSEKTWQQIIMENENETHRLEELVNRLTDQQLSTPMEAGWTVASVMAHLAFWDIRVVKLIELWKKSGVEYSPMDTELINEVTRELFIKLSPRVAAQIAIENARIVDRSIKDLSPDFIEKIRTVGQNVRLERYVHRSLHMDEIEKTLKN